MVSPKQQTLQNQFKLHDIKVTNSSNYLASQLDLKCTPTQLNEILAALKTVASKLENLPGQLSAHMTLDDLEPYLQKSAGASILVLHYADKISSRQIQRDNISLRSHLSDSIPGSRRHFEEETTRRPTEAVDHTNQPNPSSSSHDNPNANILDMTAEQLFRHLAQSADHSNFCAGEPPAETFNMVLTYTSQYVKADLSSPISKNTKEHPLYCPRCTKPFFPRSQRNCHNALQQLTHTTPEVTSPTLTTITIALQTLQCWPSTIPCQQRR